MQQTDWNDKRNLRKLIVPLVIEQLLAVTMGLADSIMVSSCGEAAVSGISLVDQISILLIGLFNAMASGGSVVAAQYMGKQDHDMVGRASNQLFLAVGGTALLFMGICMAFHRGILLFIFRTLETDVLENACTYFLITAVSFPFLGIYNSGAALFRAVGDSKISMKVSLAANILNIIGNAILIYGFDMAVAGAALSTLLSRFVSAELICVLMTRSDEIRFDRRWTPDWDMLKKILYIGVPNGIENSIFQVGKLITGSMIAGFGTVAITANAVAGSVGNYQNVPDNSIGVAMITVVGQSIGAGDEKAARKHLGRLLRIAYLSTGMVSVIMILLCRPLCGLYHLSDATTELTVTLLIYNAVCSLLIHPLSFPLANGLRAAGDVRYTMVVAIASMWLCRIVMAYILGIHLEMGLLGVWIAMTIDWLVRSVCFVVRIVSGRWLRYKDRITGSRS